MKKTSKCLAVAVMLFSLALLPHLSTVSATTQTPTSLIVPLYSYPGWTWTALIQQKQANPSVPIVAVINPASGPGWWVDSNYQSGIKSLQGAGIKVLGYVYSSYASRSLSSVESDAQRYMSWYGVNGVYVDEMNNIAGYEWYYSSLTSYAKSIGASLVIGNPGADVPSSYIGTVDSIVIYENAGLPSLSFLGGWHTSYSKSNFAVVSYNVWFDAWYIQQAANYVGYIILTDGVWPNPYSSIPSYLSTEVSTIASTEPTSLAPAGTSSSINVITTQHGYQIYGMFTTLWQNGAILQSCFSPCYFTVNSGQTYTIAVADYASFYFAGWSDGTQNRFHTVVVPTTSTAISLTATYA